MEKKPNARLYWCLLIFCVLLPLALLILLLLEVFELSTPVLSYLLPMNVIWMLYWPILYASPALLALGVVLVMLIIKSKKRPSNIQEYTQQQAQIQQQDNQQDHYSQTINETFNDIFRIKVKAVGIVLPIVIIGISIVYSELWHKSYCTYYGNGSYTCNSSLGPDTILITLAEIFTNPLAQFVLLPIYIITYYFVTKRIIKKHEEKKQKI